MRSALAAACFLGVATCSSPAAAQGSDSVAAERQYRLAQRLAADGSPDAAQAFERVVSLAPDGPLADDALLGLARLQGVPEWPEDLASLDASHAAAATVQLVKVVEQHPDADRAQEARYLLALVRLAPVAARDASKSRQDLITVASSQSGDRWTAMARYALGMLAEQEGAQDRAAGAYARIVVERTELDVVLRARVGFARTLLQAGRFGEAAVWLQSAIDAAAPSGLRTEAFRTLAVREIARDRDPARRWSSVASPLASIATTRGAALLATTTGGGLVVFDRKNATLQAFDSRGAGGPPAALDGVTALTTDPFGRVYAAAGDKLVRWDRAGLVVVAKLGSYADASAIAVDAAGTAWLADRRGDRIGRLPAGADAPVLVRESRGVGVSALILMDGHLVAAEEKTGRLVEIPEHGADKPFGPGFKKPVALAVDAAGRLSVLDAKAESVTRLGPSGEVRDTLALGTAGVSRPLALAAADDGTVRVLDGSTGAVAEAP